MFDSLKAMGAIGQLLKNKDALQQAGARIKAKLAEMRIQGGAGGGAVRAIVSGDLKLISIQLDPPVWAGVQGNEAGQAMVQGLIVEAINNAMDLAKAAAQREVGREAEAMGLPAMPGLEQLLG